MKKLILTMCMAFGLAFAFGSDTEKKDESKEWVVLLSRLDWADVQRGMAASNRWTFVEQNVTLVITNKIVEPLPMTLPPYRPIGRGATRIEPPDYLK